MVGMATLPLAFSYQDVTKCNLRHRPDLMPVPQSLHLPPQWGRGISTWICGETVHIKYTDSPKAQADGPSERSPRSTAAQGSVASWDILCSPSALISQSGQLPCFPTSGCLLGDLCS